MVLYVAETRILQTLNPLLDRNRGHRDPERVGPRNADWVLDVVVDANRDDAAFLQPVAVQVREEGQGILQVVHEFHGYDQVHFALGLPIWQPLAGVVPIGVDPPGLLDHGFRAIHPGASLASLVVPQPPDRPTVPASDIDCGKPVTQFRDRLRYHEIDAGRVAFFHSLVLPHLGPGAE